LPKQLDETRRETERDAAALRNDVQRALAGVPSELDRHEQERRLEKLERGVAAADRIGARLDELERSGAAADARLAETIAAASARAEAAITASAERTAALESR